MVRTRSDTAAAAGVGAWRAMAAYWAACAILAWRAGYWSELAAPSNPPPSPPWAVAAGLAAAAAPQPFYFAAVGKAATTARPTRSWPAVLIFASINGLLESFAFRAVRDAGAAAAAAAWRWAATTHHPPPTSAIFTGGFAALVAYCGLIHALFWERVFPPHLPRPGTPAARAMRRALALFFPMTLAFAVLDSRAVVAAHFIADAAAAAALRLQPPWSGGGGGLGVRRRAR